MSAVGIIPVRLGSALRRPLGPEYVSFHLETCKVLLGADCERATPQVHTLPIPEQTFASLENELSDSVRARWQEWINKEVEPDYLLIDLMAEANDHVAPPDPLLKLLPKIEELRASYQKSLQVVVVLVDQALTSEADALVRAARDLASKGWAFFVDPQGFVIGPKGPFRYGIFRDRLDEARYPELRKRGRGELIRRKLVTVFGHFKKKHSASSVKNYLDGRYAIAEICVELARLLETIRPKQHLTLLFDPDDCSWATLAFRNLMNQRVGRYTLLPFGELLAENNAPEQPTVLLLSVFDTGTTAARLIRDLRVCGVAVDNAVAIICTNESGKEDSVKRTPFSFKIDERKVTVSYALYVDRDMLQDSGVIAGLEPKDLCDLGNDEAELQPAEFWGMAGEAGYKGEDDVPPDRLALPVVPDFPRIAEQYGAWFAHKFKCIIDRELSPAFPHQRVRAIILVHPNERGAEPIAAALKNLFPYYDVVAVPRAVINVASGGPSGRSRTKKLETILSEAGHQEWQETLRMKVGSSVVILDEFTKGGGTFRGLNYLLQRINRGLNIALFLTVADFRPRAEPICGSKLHSLYHCPVWI